MKRKEIEPMNADETVRALRLCAEMFDCYADSTECPYAVAYDCEDELLNDAAVLIESLTAENANLRDQLDHAGLVLEAYKDDIAASQRRADAAVEDLTKLATRPIAPCHSCSKTCVFPATLAPELQPAPWCRDWEWRGVKEEA